MTARTIIRGPDPVLNMMALDDAHISADFARDLVDTLQAHPRALGLAAQQIGGLCRVIVVRQSVGPLVMPRPRVEWLGHNIKTVAEECMSFPWLRVKVERPTTGKISWEDAAGDRVAGDFTGLALRVVLHEIDHLDGITLDARRHAKKGTLTA
jgi:peptide deformylase